MNKHAITSLAISAASSAIAIWALYRLYKIKRENYCKTKEDDEISTQRHYMNEYGNLSQFSLLKDLVVKDCSKYYEEMSTYCKQVCEKYKISKNKLLIVKSRTGRLAFSLSSEFEEIIGIDDSHRMMVASQQLDKYGECLSLFPSEGILYSVPCKYTKTGSHKNVSFCEEGSLSIFKGNIKFDCMIVSNCLQDMDDPVGFLRQLSDHICMSGLLIIADSYNWSDEAILNHDQQLKRRKGKIRSVAFISEILKNGWKFLEDRNLPYCFVHSDRKMDVCNLHVTVWQRNLFETYFIPVNKL